MKYLDALEAVSFIGKIVLTTCGSQGIPSMKFRKILENFATDVGLPQSYGKKAWDALSGEGFFRDIPLKSDGRRKNKVVDPDKAEEFKACFPDKGASLHQVNW
jgi:hypothetical protein